MERFEKLMVAIMCICLLGGIVSFVNPLNSSKETKVPEGYKFSISDKESNYWFDGNGEISSYTLSQARYGEIHEGEAVLIFVTEPFSKSKQVKLDDYGNYDDKEDVLKLNSIRKFNTGLYPYSTMTSAFTGFKDIETRKVTTSIQEWCGHVFMQFNRIREHLDFVGQSYFESEGDQYLRLEGVHMEDALLNRIRLAPEKLPTGTFDIIPSTLFLRLNHHPTQVVKTVAELKTVTDQRFSPKPIQKYTLNYQMPEPREVSYYFEGKFPYSILGWEDEYKDIAWNSERKVLKTTAIRKKVIKTDYWNKNKVSHSRLQELLR